LSASHDSRSGGEQGFHLYRNEIHDTPYSGIIGGGSGHLIEENLIYRVMREMQDGGAIYGGMRNSAACQRGAMVKMGEGYGVSAYYLDEGAELWSSAWLSASAADPQPHRARSSSGNVFSPRQYDAVLPALRRVHLGQHSLCPRQDHRQPPERRQALDG
jgi:hypothetical protein